MEVVDFAQFARNRSVQAASVTPESVATPYPQTDRWADLHTQTDASSEVSEDFWSKLQLRMAYPSLYTRQN